MKKILILLLGFVTFSTLNLQAQESGGEGRATAIFAGGCFWCMEPPYDKLAGVTATVSGYSGGELKNPTYEQVSAGGTGHTEAVQISYDPDKVSYQKLLDVFWENIDPLDAGGQFCDRGDSYRAAIFYQNDKEKRLAQASKRALEKSGRFDQPIVTEIAPASQFYKAEGYHQDYYQKNSLRYKFYRYSCGRDARLEELWGEGS
ncbi:MAG: peptide-methionine (S)-S-oxide reductase MsrA [Gammaproteobacteria bacterium]|nr:peptide-methionine (S)-S-oxide reductase MsrA [Gammaproteobacteria bacterium]